MTTPRSSFTFVGNATALLRFGPLTILTDPNFLHRGELAYLGKGLFSRRLKDPAFDVTAVPPLDAIVLSHMHGDHWDRVAKNGLARSTPVLTTPKAARALVRQRFTNSEGLATWQTSTLTKDGHRLDVTAMPGRHARGLVQHLLPPVMGTMLEYTPAGGQLALRMYITGDTVLVDDLREIPRRYQAIDVAVLHLGGTTLPGGLVVTLDGRGGTDVVELIGPGEAIPVHYDDYGRFKSPLADFETEMRRRGLAGLIRRVGRGETVELGLGGPE
jgi:L-ascorbate metabolism protein UlaG (beta-lactamase superfamily)